VPKRNLTDRTLKALKPVHPETERPLRPGEHYDLMDAGFPGFGVRVSETGRRTFVLVARYAGSKNPARRRLGVYPKMTLGDAHLKARSWLALMEQGKDPAEEEKRRALEDARRRQNTFAAVAEDFIKEKVRTERKGREVERDIRREFLEAWGKRPITDITALDVRAIIKAKASTAQPQAHNLLGHAKRLFAWAVDQEVYGLASSPCERLKPKALIGKKAVRTRVLTDDEWRALWRSAEGMAYPYGPLFRMLALTGQRKSEVAEARWSEFALGRKLWTIPPERMKADSPHVVPLTDEVVEILEGLPRFEAGDYLFSTTGGKKPINGFSKGKARLDRLMLAELRRSIDDDKASEKVKLAPFVIHDLRRSVRTGMSALPISSDVAELVIAHARPGLRKVYDQFGYLDEKRRALELWAARLRSIVEPPPANIVKLPARA
jgi:integrase